MHVADLDLDLDVFAGPFDLLLTLVLREEVDLLEVDLAGVVLTYLEHLEASGELDLEAATEFVVLMAALLELKSRLMLPRSDEEEGLELEPGEAAAELLARLLEAHRYRGGARWLDERLAAQAGHRFRSAPLPPQLRRARIVEAPAGAYDAALLGRALGSLLRVPPAPDLRHMAQLRVSLGERLTHLRALLSRGRFSFEDAVGGGDRATVAVTLLALLELHRRGEASWRQDEPFAPILVEAAPDRQGVPL